MVALLDAKLKPNLCQMMDALALMPAHDLSFFQVTDGPGPPEWHAANHGVLLAVQQSAGGGQCGHVAPLGAGL
jgi:hypothetical protein